MRGELRIITERKLREFSEVKTRAEASQRKNVMRQWINVVRAADWGNLSEIKQTFNSVDAFGDCVIFDVGGNKYRIIGKVGYQKHLVFIRFVLTHSEYDKKQWQPDCK